MKTRSLRHIAALSLLIACLPIQAQNASESTVDLKFRPQTGERRLLRLDVTQRATQVMPKRKSTLHHIFSMDIEHVVTGVETNGEVLMRSTVQNTKFKRVIAGRTIFDYDSRRDGGKSTPGDDETTALLVGTVLDLTFSPQGKLIGLRNKAEVIEKMLDKMKVSAENRKWMREMMDEEFGSNAFQSIGNLFASFPDSATQIGSSWPKRDAVSQDSGLVYDGRVTLTNLENGFARLDYLADIKPADAKVKNRSLPQGVQTGAYFVEPRTGWTQQANLQQRITARVTPSGLISPTAKTGNMVYLRSEFRVSTLSRQ